MKSGGLAFHFVSPGGEARFWPQREAESSNVCPVRGTAAKSWLVAVSGVHRLTVVRSEAGPNQRAPMVSSRPGPHWPAFLGVYPFSEFSFLVFSSVNSDTVLTHPFLLGVNKLVSLA